MMIEEIRKRWGLLKLNIYNSLPKFVRYRKDFVRLPIRWLRRKDGGIKEENWDKGGFLCLCDDHVDEFENEDDVSDGTTLGYYICDAHGCGSIATYELFRGMKKSLREGGLLPDEDVDS